MLLVVASSKETSNDLANLLKSNGYSFKKMFRRIFYVEATLSSFTLSNSKLIASVEEDFPIERMEPQATIEIDNDIRTKNTTPTQALRSWARHRITRRSNPFNREGTEVKDDFDLPFYSTRTGFGVDLYHMDEGMDTHHVELFGRVTNIDTGETLFKDDTATEENFQTYHGTWTGACAYGATVGIAPNVSVFYSAQGENPGADEPITPGAGSFLGSFDHMYQHYMSRAATNRPGVLSASYAGYGLFNPTDGEASPAVLAAMEDMMDDGLIFVTAAGNAAFDTDNFYVYPAEMHPDIIVCGGTNAYDGLYYALGGGTCVGSVVSIYAPAEKVMLPAYDPLADDLYIGNVSGTSFATPYTAGVVCCMLEGYQRLTSIEQVRAVKNKLISNSTKDVIKNTEAYHPGEVFHNNLLYLDPFVTIENIPGLNKI